MFAMHFRQMLLGGYVLNTIKIYFTEMKQMEDILLNHDELFIFYIFFTSG